MSRWNCEHANCLDWLLKQPVNSFHAVCTDPPYGLVEFSSAEVVKLRAGRGGVWRLPPKFDGKEPGANGLAIDKSGSLILCQHGDRRIARLEKDGKFTTLADKYQGKRLNSPNDLVFHPNGDLYFTDPPYGLPKQMQDPGKELDFQGVYRMKPSGELSCERSR